MNKKWCVIDSWTNVRGVKEYRKLYDVIYDKPHKAIYLSQYYYSKYSKKSDNDKERHAGAFTWAPRSFLAPFLCRFSANLFFRRIMWIHFQNTTSTVADFECPTQTLQLIFLFNWFFYPSGTFSILFATFVLVCCWKVNLMFAQLLLNWLNIHCSTEIVSKSCFFLVLPLILLLYFSRPSTLEGFSNIIFAARLNCLTQFSTLYLISPEKLYLISLGYHFLLKYL